MSNTPARKRSKITVKNILDKKANKERIVALGVYDAPMAAISDEIVRRQGFWDHWRRELTEALAHQGCHIRLPLLDEASGAV